MKLKTLIGEVPGTIEIEGSHFRYRRADGQSVEGDFSLADLDPGCHSVLIAGRSFRVTAGSLEVEVFDPRDLRGRKAGGASQGRQEVMAPMPGKVVRVLAAVGDAVESGQGLVVVEAMKMQNEMKSPKAGRVIEVKTRPEATVAAGEVLMVIE
jgi:biotin carboxyl carrier protein